MKKKLRLILFDECNRTCEGCCNNDWNVQSLPQIEWFREFDEVILTGGEPMLKPEVIIDTVYKARNQGMTGPIYMYTAKSKRAIDIVTMLHVLDGITLTLHEQYDVPGFIVLNDWLKELNIPNKSLRLNIFKGINIPKDINTSLWKIKSDIEWVKNCPLPDNETLMRL